MEKSHTELSMKTEPFLSYTMWLQFLIKALNPFQIFKAQSQCTCTHNTMHKSLKVNNHCIIILPRD